MSNTAQSASRGMSYEVGKKKVELLGADGLAISENGALDMVVSRCDSQASVPLRYATGGDRPARRARPLSGSRPALQPWAPSTAHRSMAPRSSTWIVARYGSQESYATRFGDC